MKEDQRSLVKRTLKEDKTKRSRKTNSLLLLTVHVFFLYYDWILGKCIPLFDQKTTPVVYYSKLLNFTSFSSLSFFRKRRRYARRIYKKKKKKKSPRRRRVLRKKTVSSLRERESSSRFREGSTRPRRLAARRRYRRWLFSSVLLR